MKQETETSLKACFVVMPISDAETYETGHFGRVYEHIIKPACKLAGFRPIRADEVQVTNYIVIDILRKILEAEIVVCDLSSRNPNVLYELGIRQAFNLPVTLIRDSKTPRIFDIQGLRDIEYDESLRIDKIQSAVESLSNVLKNTSNRDESDVNSIIQLLGVKPAAVPSIEVSKDTSLLLNAISDIGKRISRLEDITVKSIPIPLASNRDDAPKLPQTTGRSVFGTLAEPIIKGMRVYNSGLGTGEVISLDDEYVIVQFGESLVRFKIEDGVVDDLAVTNQD